LGGGGNKIKNKNMTIFVGYIKHVRLIPSKKHKIKRGPIVTKGVITQRTHDPLGPIEQGRVDIAPKFYPYCNLCPHFRQR
jgi:hypothetical protein